jgi:hypothetical protein
VTHPPTLVQVGLTIGRWLLPLVAVVFLSTTLAYAVNGAIAGEHSAGVRQPNSHTVSVGAATEPAAVERSTTSPSAQPADLGPLLTPKRCPPIDGSFMDTVILTETRRIDCGWPATVSQLTSADSDRSVSPSTAGAVSRCLE